MSHRARASLCLAACVAAALLLAVHAGAQTEGEPAELTRIRAEIHAVEERLRALVKQQEDLTARRQQLEGELELARLRVKEGEAEHAQVVKIEADAVRAAEAAQAELVAAANHLRTQLTMLAVLGKSGFAPLVVHAVLGGGDVQHRVTLLRAVVREQQHRREEMARLVEQRSAALATLSQRRQEAEVAMDKVLGRRRELIDTRSRVVAQLAQLEQQRRAGAVQLAAAREREARLERLWGIVTQDDSERRSDIRLLRGGLPWPVGRFSVIEPYGRRRDPRYGTVTVSHGLLLSVDAGEHVGAVAEGSVAYAQFFKDYGNLVIVNHGAKVYSLYARLSAMLVRAGQRVGMGEAIGVTGPAENGGGNFYLEVRVGETPQDPNGWLRPAPR